MLRQMWKKRVCFVLAVILAALAVTPVYDRLGCSICGKVADGFIYEIMKIEQKVLEGIGKIE